MAKENNCGPINSAQKAGRIAKSALKPHGKGNRKGKGKQAKVDAIKGNGDTSDDDAGEPVLVLKPRGKPGPKPVENQAQSPWKTRSKARYKAQADGD